MADDTINYRVTRVVKQRPSSAGRNRFQARSNVANNSIMPRGVMTSTPAHNGGAAPAFSAMHTPNRATMFAPSAVKGSSLTSIS
jgi:hypothetical protein